MRKTVPLNQAFNKMKNSYEVINRMKMCREHGAEVVYITRYEFMTIEKFMFLVVELSNQGYSLDEIKYFIKNREYEDKI